MLAELIHPIRRFRALRRNARLYLLSNTLQAATAGAAGVLYTLYLTSLGYGTGFIGLVAVVGTIGGGMGIIPAGWLVRRVGWRTGLIWSDLIGGVSVALQLVLPSTPVILLTSLGIGASVAFILVINTPLLAAYSEPSERTALYGLSNALALLATVAGSLLAGFLRDVFARPDVQATGLLTVLQPLLVPGAEARSYELALLISGAIAMPSIIPVLMMREDAKDGSRGSPEQVGSQVMPVMPWRMRLGTWVASARSVAEGLIGRFAATQALLGFGAGIFFPFVNLYFVKRLGASTSYVGVLTAALALVVAGGSLLAAPLAQRVGRLRVAVGMQVASLPFLLALGAFPIIWLASLTYLIRGSLMAVNAPPLQTFLMEAVPEESRVLASSAYNVSFQVAWALGAAFGGLLVGWSGYRITFVAAAPFYALSALLLTVWFARRRRWSADIPRLSA
jgi:MFS family permease